MPRIGFNWELAHGSAPVGNSAKSQGRTAVQPYQRLHLFRQCRTAVRHEKNRIFLTEPLGSAGYWYSGPNWISTAVGPDGRPALSTIAFISTMAHGRAPGKNPDFFWQNRTAVRW